MDVTEWLRSLGLEQYAPAFEQNHIRPELLSSLTADDLKELGIASVGHRREMLEAIAGLRARPAPAADVPTPEPAAGSAAERRQLTVMFCDLVGSTALSARLDLEELREVIGAYHRCVTETVRRFDGLVAKYMGDGVLIYFGFPQAHEDDAERAVRAGLDIVADVGGLDTPAGGKLQVRIGIATGLVVVGDLVGEGAAQEQAVVGETPNLAARLPALAEPGAIVIAAATRRLLGNLFRLPGLGRHEVKGLSEPVEAWAVEGVSASEGRFEAVRSGRLTGFVGREQELGLLLERWNLAQGGEGQVVLLSSEPGIGKSRILAELRGSRGRSCDKPAPSLLALLRQQRVLPDHRQFRARPALCAEDIHWADPTTLEVMDLLIHRVRNIPLLVVLTHRPEFSSRWSHYGHVAALTLTKLTRPQTAAMVSRLAGGKALPAELLDQILGKTDGVPLFVEELTRSILESGDLNEVDDRWEYAGHAGTLAIPLTLRDSLMARVDRFTPVKEIAQIGAAIGREFSYELIAAVAPHAKPALDQALAQLTQSGLAFQQGTPPDAVYTFKHALVQDAAYDLLLRRRRQELHGKIARAIEERLPQTGATEPELLAHHYAEAKQPDKAIPLWQKAGSLALKRMALTEAIAHLNKGLELGLAAFVERRSGRRGARLYRFARLGANAAGEILGAAHRDQLCAADARPGKDRRSPRTARAGLWLVHRRLRDEGPEGSQGAARGTRNIRLAGVGSADLNALQRPLDVREEIGPGFEPGREAHQGIRYAELGARLGCQSRIGRRRRMGDKAVRIAEVVRDVVEPQQIEKAEAFLLAAADLEGDEAAARFHLAVGVIVLRVWLGSPG